jgi:hypothetical protein
VSRLGVTVWAVAANAERQKSGIIFVAWILRIQKSSASAFVSADIAKVLNRKPILIGT